MTDRAGAALPPPPVAGEVFGDRLPLAVRYVELLAGSGVERGLIGPREQARLWQRHVLNSAALAELIPASVRLVDVGAGAGLPGIPVALARPDLQVVLVEPLARRVQFLTEVVDALGLAAQVGIVRGRAEEPAVAVAVGRVHWVTARAVAPLDRLLRWCRPLLAPGATLLAMKGATVWEELETHHAALRSLGVADASIVQIGTRLPDPTWVAVLRMSTAVRGQQHDERKHGGRRRFT